MTLWTKGGDVPVTVDKLPFRLVRASGEFVGHTVTEIWRWPVDEQAQVLAECGYVTAPERPEPDPGCVVVWNGSAWEQRVQAPLVIESAGSVGTDSASLTSSGGTLA